MAEREAGQTVSPRSRRARPRTRGLAQCREPHRAEGGRVRAAEHGSLLDPRTAICAAVLPGSMDAVYDIHKSSKAKVAQGIFALCLTSSKCPSNRRRTRPGPTLPCDF